MFVLSTFKNAIRIAPNDLGRDVKTVLIEEINKHFANFVIPDVGLCISFYNFEKVGASYILPGDGYTCTPVVFRYVMFQPLIGEIMEGTISKSSRDGLFVSMLFFHDIEIEPDKFPKISKFDENEQTWYWECNSGESVVKMLMEPGKRIRFRVSSVHIKASIVEPGLGPLQWWENNESDVKMEG
uniref:DNA-directed RNA polymerase III subunit RPC8 n=1 Tax=Ditylenchus dipsaci TaxID=166011 RepID=A0A915ED61_9BILA